MSKSLGSLGCRSKSACVNLFHSRFGFLSHTLVNTGEKKQAVPVQVNEFDTAYLEERERNQLKAKHSGANCAIFAQTVRTNWVQHRFCRLVCTVPDFQIPLVNWTLKHEQINDAIRGRSSFLLNSPSLYSAQTKRNQISLPLWWR